MNSDVLILGIAPDDFEFRIRELKAARAAKLDGTVQDDVLTGREDVFQESLVGKRRTRRPAVVADNELEDPEARTTCRPDAGRQNLGGNCRGGAGPEARDLDERSAILVTERKTKEQVFD